MYAVPARWPHGTRPNRAGHHLHGGGHQDPPCIVQGGRARSRYVRRGLPRVVVLEGGVGHLVVGDSVFCVHSHAVGTTPPPLLAVPLEVHKSTRRGGATGRGQHTPELLLGAVEVAVRVVAWLGARLNHLAEQKPLGVGVLALATAEAGGPNKQGLAVRVPPPKCSRIRGALGTKFWAPKPLLCGQPRYHPAGGGVDGHPLLPSYDPIRRSSSQRMPGWRCCRGPVEQASATKTGRVAGKIGSGHLC